MSNAVFGKTMKNLRNRVDVRMANNEKNYLKWTSKPSYVALYKPAYVGMCKLELSKVPMYEFHYDYIKNKYGNKQRLLFTDTDSLMYEIETENVYDNFSKNKEMIDFSNYCSKPKYYDDSNILVVAKMKDKMGGIVIEEFVGLKPKMYLTLLRDSSEYKIK